MKNQTNSGSTNAGNTKKIQITNCSELFKFNKFAKIATMIEQAALAYNRMKDSAAHNLSYIIEKNFSPGHLTDDKFIDFVKNEYNGFVPYEDYIQECKNDGVDPEPTESDYICTIYDNDPYVYELLSKKIKDDSIEKIGIFLDLCTSKTYNITLDIYRQKDEFLKKFNIKEIHKTSNCYYYYYEITEGEQIYKFHVKVSNERENELIQIMHENNLPLIVLTETLNNIDKDNTYNFIDKFLDFYDFEFDGHYIYNIIWELYQEQLSYYRNKY